MSNTHRSLFVVLTLAMAAAGLHAEPASKPAAPQNTAAADRPSPPPVQAPPTSQPGSGPIKVALFDLDVVGGPDSIPIDPGSLTDQVNLLLAEMPRVVIVNRDQIRKVAQEHQMALSGLVDNASAVKLGGFLAADFVMVGRASRIGQTDYLVLKIIDVHTTVQTTVSAKSPAENGPEALLGRLRAALGPKLDQLRQPAPAGDEAALRRLREAAGFLSGKVVLVNVTERHVNRPLADPAAQTAILNRLRAIGVEAVIPANPLWRQKLLESGTCAGRRVDYLLEGEGTSAFAAQVHGMVSCRARVELRLVRVPGQFLTAAQAGVAAQVDLVEELAAKAALEAAGVNALETLLTSYPSQHDVPEHAAPTSQP